VPSPDVPGTTSYLWDVQARTATDAWAVGGYVDATGRSYALALHWDGQQWSVLPSPTFGTASAMLDAVTASGGGVWAVGETDDAHDGGRPLVEQFTGGSWQAVALPAAGSAFTDLWGVAAASGTTWAVGTFYNPIADRNQTLILRGDGSTWSVVNGPDPGSGDNILAGITAVPGQLWAVGTYDDGGNRLPLLEQHPG